MSPADAEDGDASSAPSTGGSLDASRTPVGNDVAVSKRDAALEGPADSMPSQSAGDAGDNGEVVNETCDESKRTPPAKPVKFKGTDFIFSSSGGKDEPPTGAHKVTIEQDPSFDKYTIFRPEFGEAALPIIAWAEGGCLKDGLFFGEFLLEIASHGFLVIADGAPNGSGNGGGLMSDPGPQTKAIDWAYAENERPCSPYYHKLDTEKVAVMGQSCGGLMSMAAAGDPRVTTAILWNSGLFERDSALYSKLHSSIAIIDGGPDDVAYENGKADFEAIDTVPIMFANDKTKGHGGSYWDDNGGTWAQVGVSWLNWQLHGDTGSKGKGTFLGADCSLCKDSKWTLEFKKLQ